MFDISWTEILVIGVVALIAIGPRELPRVLYELGRWVRRLRAMAAEFQRHFSDFPDIARQSPLKSNDATFAEFCAGQARQIPSR